MNEENKIEFNEQDAKRFSLDMALAFLKENRGGLVLMAITFLLSLLGAVITSLCGAEYTTTVITAQSFGLLGILTVSALFWFADMEEPMGSKWGVLGTIIGTFVTMCVF